ncbi:wax ester/triacylglycerol synthase family O-acyltransferase [Mycolicibacterium peregrinum]|uniref:wax ester/triacylglycerol synthase family O-acyltransferase n=1 Tax=Mycolicibacterium peregrinum TaxID=43304 RepID=UPI000B4BC45D|nr:wax ester/triacylglycerol synthase family O-acyltransferase [Mycolicibacterium peregrinum]OWL94087.1 wax ester/triacylglycerol synthase family O-acyltransferase [Mycolicibacterium peregrinum]
MDWLDPLDAAMITADMVSNPLNIGAVLILSPPPGADPGYVDDVYRDTLLAGEPLDPRLCRFPHRGVDTAGCWVWRKAGAIDLRQHYRRRTVAPGTDRAGMWELIGALHAEPLDKSRPMWMAYLIDGLDDGQFAFYIKLHHIVMDGVAGLQTLTGALSADPERRSMPAFHSDRYGPADEPSGHRGSWIPNPLALLHSVLDTATSSVALAERVVTGQVTSALAGLTGDTTMPPVAAPCVRFNSRLGPERAVTAATWPKSRFQAFASTAGVTSNDVVTAVIAGALRQWLLDQGELPRRSLVAICPVTVHGHELSRSERHGNMFGAWLCPLGTNLSDPAERLHLIHRSMSEGKRRVAARGAAASLLLLATSIAPTVLLPMLPFAPKFRVGYNLPISHVPGPRCEMYWNGAHIDEIYPISAVYDGQALNVTTCSYADRIGFGFVAGREIVPDVPDLIPLTERALTELEHAVGID